MSRNNTLKFLRSPTDKTPSEVFYKLELLASIFWTEDFLKTPTKYRLPSSSLKVFPEVPDGIKYVSNLLHISNI